MLKMIGGIFVNNRTFSMSVCFRSDVT